MNLQKEDYHRTSHEKILVIVFDETCWFCRTLSYLVVRHAPKKVRAIPWTRFRTEYSKESLPATPKELAVVDNTGAYFGCEAWNLLVKTVPTLNTLDWLARKIGVSKGLAPVMQKQGHRIRKLCFRCRSKP